MGADRSRQKTDMEMFDGTEMIRVVEIAGAGAEVEAAAKAEDISHRIGIKSAPAAHTTSYTIKKREQS
jgi:hypothetical protein